MRLLDILAKASEVEEAETAEAVCCWLLIMCDEEVASLAFDATWRLLLWAVMAEAEAAEAAEAAVAEDPVNANKLALNGLASTIPLALPLATNLPPTSLLPILYFDDEACCEVAAAAMEDEAVMEDEALTSELLLASKVEVIFRASLDWMDDISALAAASMVEATAAEGAVLGRCLHLCRLKNKVNFFFFFHLRWKPLKSR